MSCDKVLGSACSRHGARCGRDERAQRVNWGAEVVNGGWCSLTANGTNRTGFLGGKMLYHDRERRAKIVFARDEGERVRATAGRFAGIGGTRVPGSPPPSVAEKWGGPGTAGIRCRQPVRRHRLARTWACGLNGNGGKPDYLASLPTQGMKYFWIVTGAVLQELETSTSLLTTVPLPRPSMISTRTV